MIYCWMSDNKRADAFVHQLFYVGVIMYFYVIVLGFWKFEFADQ